MKLLPILILSLCVAIVVQEFIPPLPWLHCARVFLLPLIVLYGSLALPFWGMCILVMCAGFLWDAWMLQPLDSKVEIPFGWSILIYALLGAIMQGFRPLFLRGRWEIHCLLSGLCTSFILLVEYLFITYRRSSIVMNSEVWWRILGPGLVAMVLAPFVFWGYRSISRLIGYQAAPED